MIAYCCRPGTDPKTVPGGSTPIKRCSPEPTDRDPVGVPAQNPADADALSAETAWLSGRTEPTSPQTASKHATLTVKP